MSDYTKHQFLSLWPTGYRETFDGYGSHARETVKDAVTSNARGSTCLEIGCGDGYFTKEWLVPLFEKLYAIDLRPSARELSGCPKVTYLEAGDRDYTCSGVPDQSVDFVYSFGCFCHLPVSACASYLKSFRRVMRPGAAAVIMFANWNRHPSLRMMEKPEQYAEENNGMDWFFNNEQFSRKLIESAGFTNFKDLKPDFRDTLAYFENPLVAT